MAHFEETLQRAIDLIRGKVLEMTGMAERALKDSVRALQENNRQIAYSIILRDQQIDELEKEIDRLCLEFILKQQPVAGHLRFVYATIKINAEVERIGDYAESIARQILKLSALNQKMPVDRLVEIAGISIPMFHDAIQSFLKQDGEKAQRTMAHEEEVDQLRNAINAELFQMRTENRIPLEALTPLMTIARRFERVSDQAKNICEEVLYMCTGEYVKHKGTEAYRICFLDGENSLLSQLAEGIGNSLAQPKFVFSSAGLNPQPIDPEVVRFLKEKGQDISKQKSKSIDQIPHLEFYQIFVALTPEARRRLPSNLPNKIVILEWAIPGAETARDKREFLEKSYQVIHAHIEDLAEAVLGDKND